MTVDDRMRAADGVWAIGDAAGIGLLTHLGKYQARVAAANVAGRDVPADYRAIPGGGLHRSRRSRRSARWRATTSSSRATTSPAGGSRRTSGPSGPGFVKLAADRERRVLVGAIAVGPEAGEWLGQLTLAVRAEVPLDVLLDTIQPYPTFSEAIFERAAGARATALGELSDARG